MMMDIDRQREEAERLRKDGRYAEAVTSYQELWVHETADAWIGWGLAFCLEKLGRLREALDVCREVYQIDRGHVYNRSLYAWVVYKLEVAPNDRTDLPRMLKAANAVLRLTAQDDRYAPYSATVLKVAERLLKRGRSEDALTWLDRLDDQLLSTQTGRSSAGGGRTRAFPSDAQRYFMLRARTLFDLERFDECRHVVACALACIEEFTNDGDVWLKRLDARSLAATGDTPGGYAALEKLLHRTPSWFIHGDLAALARTMQRHDEAWHHITEALLGGADVEMRLRVLSMVSEWLEEDGQADAARAHYELVLAVRNENGWSLKPAHRKRGHLLGCDLAATGSAAREHVLKKTWHAWREAYNPRLSGWIVTLLGEGAAGFIRTDDDASYYFRAKGIHGRLEQGAAVTFRTAPGFDRKKGVPTTIAVDVRIVDSAG